VRAADETCGMVEKAVRSIQRTEVTDRKQQLTGCGRPPCWTLADRRRTGARVFLSIRSRSQILRSAYGVEGSSCKSMYHIVSEPSYFQARQGFRAYTQSDGDPLSLHEVRASAVRVRCPSPFHLKFAVYVKPNNIPKRLVAKRPPLVTSNRGTELQSNSPTTFIPPSESAMRSRPPSMDAGQMTAID
jgi:hypothetical protein